MERLKNFYNGAENKIFESLDSFMTNYRQYSRKEFAEKYDYMETFKNIFNASPYFALKFAFYVRMHRSGVGLGCRAIFYDMICYYIDNVPFELFTKVLESGAFQEYGRWDDLIEIYLRAKIALDFATPELNFAIADTISEYLHKQILADYKICKYLPEVPPVTPSISLCAKWLPSINSRNEIVSCTAKLFMTDWEMSPRKYRQMLSLIRKTLRIPEVLASQESWEGMRSAFMTNSFVSRHSSRLNDAGISVYEAMHLIRDNHCVYKKNCANANNYSDPAFHQVSIAQFTKTVYFTLADQHCMKDLHNAYKDYKDIATSTIINELVQGINF